MEFKGFFYNVGKTLDIIATKLAYNEAIRKLVYYGDKSIDNVEDINPEVLIPNYIKTTPFISADDEGSTIKNYIIIVPDIVVTIPTSNNKPFRFKIDILCHIDAWETSYQCTRPLLIANEVCKELENARFSQLGVVNFVGFSIITGESYMGASCLFELSD